MSIKILSLYEQIEIKNNALCAICRKKRGEHYSAWRNNKYDGRPEIAVYCDPLVSPLRSEDRTFTELYGIDRKNPNDAFKVRNG